MIKLHNQLGKNVSVFCILARNVGERYKRRSRFFGHNDTLKRHLRLTGRGWSVVRFQWIVSFFSSDMLDSGFACQNSISALDTLLSRIRDEPPRQSVVGGLSSDLN